MIRNFLPRPAIPEMHVNRLSTPMPPEGELVGQVIEAGNKDARMKARRRRLGGTVLLFVGAVSAAIGIGFTVKNASQEGQLPPPQTQPFEWNYDVAGAPPDVPIPVPVSHPDMSNPVSLRVPDWEPVTLGGLGVLNLVAGSATLFSGSFQRLREEVVGRVSGSIACGASPPPDELHPARELFPPEESLA